MTFLRPMKELRVEGKLPPQSLEGQAHPGVPAEASLSGAETTRTTDQRAGGAVAQHESEKFLAAFIVFEGSQHLGELQLAKLYQIFHIEISRKMHFAPAGEECGSGSERDARNKDTLSRGRFNRALFHQGRVPIFVLNSNISVTVIVRYGLQLGGSFRLSALPYCVGYFRFFVFPHQLQNQFINMYKIAGILIGIVFNLQINWQNCFITILSLPVYENKIPPHLFRILISSVFCSFPHICPIFILGCFC